jgi:hypothetical protein
MAEKTPMRLDLLEILGAAAGGAIAYLLTTHLPGLVSAVGCAVAIALLSFASARLTRPILWWTSIGAIAGSVVGAGTMLAASLAGEHASRQMVLRYTFLGTLGIGGLVAGIFLGKDIEQESIPRPAEFLKRASGLTAVLFAIVVTSHFPGHGLEAARTLASRLSTTTTILATTIAVPGWIGFRIGERVGAWLRSRLDRRGPSAQDGARSPDAVPRQPIRSRRAP